MPITVHTPKGVYRSDKLTKAQKQELKENNPELLKRLQKASTKTKGAKA